jgi:ferric-dicitrate binding protein FerR (iron transport regulator)
VNDNGEFDDVIDLLLQAQQPDAADDMKDRLNERLRSDAEARKAVSQFLADEASITLNLKTDTITDFVVDDVISFPETPMKRVPPGFLVSWRAAAAVLVLGAGALYAAWWSSQEQPIMEIAQLSGSFRWTGDGGRVQQRLHRGMMLGGGTLESMDSDSWVELAFVDGTRVTVSGQSLLTVSDFGQKELHLRRGVFSADVAKQPDGKPMRIITPSAEAKVLGTQLNIVAAPFSTRLTVNEGRVRVTRLADGSTQDVPADHLVIAEIERNKDFTLMRQNEATDQWRPTLPDDMTYGKWQSGIAADAGAVRAAPILWRESEEEEQVLLYLAAMKATSKDASHVMITDKTVFRVRGRLGLKHGVLFGLTTHHAKGGFAGKYLAGREVEATKGPGGVFEIELPIAHFRAQKEHFPKSPVGLELIDWWSLTVNRDAGLEIISVELVTSR